MACWVFETPFVGCFPCWDCQLEDDRLDTGAGRSMTSSSSRSCNKAVGNTIDDVQRTRTRKYPITSTESRKQVAVDVCAQSILTVIALVKATAVMTVATDMSLMMIAVIFVIVVCGLLLVGRIFIVTTIVIKVFASLCKGQRSEWAPLQEHDAITRNPKPCLRLRPVVHPPTQRRLSKSRALGPTAG